jgi:1A family penicillin-binding protein
MPIPQISNSPVRSPQSWKNETKKKINSGAKSWKTGAKRLATRNENGNFNWWPLIKLGAVVAGAGLLVMLIAFVVLSQGLPQPDKLINREVAESTKIYDRTGETILYEIHGDQKRTLIDLQEIPTYVQKATIAVEDKNFYNHSGFSLMAIARTAVTNILFNKKAGGSTLTQQFVKNAVLSTEKKYTRKIKELILSYKLEKSFSKDQILQMYLNEIPYGSNAYGVEAASQFYFGKSVRETNLAEAAVLAALPQGPSRYSPYGPNKDILIGRQHYILDLMVEQGYVSKEEAESAKGTELKFQDRIDNIIAPHFIMYLKELLSEKYGDKTVEQGGLKIITTLDVKKQEIAEKVVKDYALKNQTKYNASNAALVSIDPKTGQVLAMVGSRDYFDDSIDGQVNVALKARQPGSSFKPIVYTQAFIRGYLPETKVYDVATNFSNDPAKPYEPKNYNGADHGPVSFRQALAGSLNVSAVKVLYLAGVDNVINFAKKLGYSSLGDKDQYGLTLVLGGGEVRLLEHTNAFSAFAQEGRLPELNFVLKIEDNKGEVLEEFKEAKITEVFPANIARMTSSILSDNAARSYVFGASNYLNLGDRPAAAKTGTTNDYRDAWTIGYTPSLVTGVWTGNNDNSKMKVGADGSQVAAPIWRDYMRQALADSPVESFTNYSIPENTKPIILGQGFAENKVKIDKSSGLLASDLTPAEFIIEKSFFVGHDLLYYIDKDDPNGEAPANPASDPQFDLWEQGVKTWIEKKQKEDPSFSIETPPTETDNLHRLENRPVFTVFGLADGDTLTQAMPNISIQATAPRGINRSEYYFNDRLFASNFSYPFGLNRAINVLPSGNYQLKIRLCDDVDNCSEQSFNISLAVAGAVSGLDYGLSWLSPATDTKISSSSFPLELAVSIFNAEAVADLSFFYKSPSGETKLIDKKRLVRNQSVSTWLSSSVDLIPGTYQFWAEAYDWQGNKKETEPIKLDYK